MAPQAYLKVIKAITSRKLKEPFFPYEATKICRPKNPERSERFSHHTGEEIPLAIKHYSSS